MGEGDDEEALLLTADDEDGLAVVAMTIDM